MCGAARGDDSELLRLIPGGSDDDVTGSDVSHNKTASTAGGASRAFVTFKSFAAATTARQVRVCVSCACHRSAATDCYVHTQKLQTESSTGSADA
jgi:hypothetical protein